MREYFKKKTWIIASIIVFTSILISMTIVFFEFNGKTKISLAGEEDNIRGYAWSDSIGWISFNCINNDTCATIDYGVNIEPATGDFIGYAWSENIGWIDFSPNEGYPKEPFISAHYDHITGDVLGWAKILSLGDDGWLKMSGAWSNGVSINSVTGDFNGWAWNSNDNGAGIGWVSFNCLNDSSCAVSDYKVSGSINIPPTVINLSAPNWNFANACGALGAKNAILRWEYSDVNNVPEGVDPQSAYQVIFDDDSDPANPLINTGKVNGVVSQYAVDSSSLAYNTQYYWWVIVWDDYDTASATTTCPSFTTYKHEFPDVDFSWISSNPSKGEIVKFTDDSDAFGGAAIIGWLWTVPFDASINDNGSATPIIIFNSSANQPVTLEATDSDGYYCSKTKIININVSLPLWKEVK